MFNGTGSQTGTVGRWGDYSMTTIDPADGMTFWHVNEYYAATSSFNWHTRIGKFNFVGGGPTPTPTPTANRYPKPTLPAAGRPVRTCRVSGPAWLAFISRLMASFTLWAAAAPTQLAASSLTRLNMIQLPTVGPPSRPLTPTPM